MLDSAFESVSDLISDSAFDSGINLVINDVIVLIGPAANSALLKMTFRLIRTALLIRFHNLNMVEASYFNSYSFSDRDAILPSALICDLSAYTAHPKILICL
jgi:hypothetical protein